MLVLSRRLNEKIIFPESNTMVQVVGMKAGVVRLGVRAPAEVTVLRQEVHERRAEWSPPHTPTAGEAPADASASGDGERAWLKSASLGLGLARLQLRVGQMQDAQETLARLHSQLQRVRQHLEGIEAEADPIASAAVAVDEQYATAPEDGREFATCCPEGPA
jgi:carbon storage regulator CsrA